MPAARRLVRRVTALLLLCRVAVGAPAAAVQEPAIFFATYGPHSGDSFVAIEYARLSHPASQIYLSAYLRVGVGASNAPLWDAHPLVRATPRGARRRRRCDPRTASQRASSAARARECGSTSQRDAPARRSGPPPPVPIAGPASRALGVRHVACC